MEGPAEGSAPTSVGADPPEAGAASATVDPDRGDASSAAVDPDRWRRAFEQRQRLVEKKEREATGGEPSEAPEPSAAPEPSDPDTMYPPRREAPNLVSTPYSDTSWELLYGQNAPPQKSPEPLPPIGPSFFFRVMVEQPVHERPDPNSAEIDTRSKGEVVRIVDFNGAWVRLAAETEAQVAANFEGWMLSEDAQDGSLLEEIEDPEETEKEYTKNLFRRIWKVTDHVAVRLREKGEKATQYLKTGRVPPGDRSTLPEGTRCLSAFWGLEARFVKLLPSEEYWPQGCLTLAPSVLKAGWEQPKEEARSGHWRVFAARPFGAHELVEVCPLVKVDNLEAMFASMPLRMNVVETPADEDAHLTGKRGRVRNNLPLGFGMLYQQSIELWDVQVNWTPVTNYNCKMLPIAGHMYIYTTRKVQANEELVLEYKRNFRTDEGEVIDFTGFTPYWMRQKPPANFAKALTTPHGPRKVRPPPGSVKFGRSRLHERGCYADASFKKGEIVEMCPCLVLDQNGADCMQDYAFHVPAVKVKVGDRELVKREERFLLPLGNGGMYNHLDEKSGENVTWHYDETTQCIVFVAKPQGDEAEVSRNEELCFDYGEAYWDAPARRHQRPGYKSEFRDVLKDLEAKTAVLDASGQRRYL